MDDFKPIGGCLPSLTDAAASLEQSTKGSTSSEAAHKRQFLQTFRRWEILFKRKDGNVESDKWLIAEYYKSLGHLSATGFDKLTEILKETCVFFPTIKECLDATRYGRFDYGHPFHSKPHLLRYSAPPARQIEHHHG